MDQTAPLHPYIEIDAVNLRHNLATLQQLSDKAKAKFLAVVLKGNAYGHGLELIYSLIVDRVQWVVLFDGREALRLKELFPEATTQFLVLGHFSPESAPALAEAGVSVGLSGDEDLQGIHRHLKGRPHTPPLRVHLMVETGLGREGISLAQLPQKLNLILGLQPQLQITGLYSHFANTEDVTVQSYAQYQLQQLQVAKSILYQHRCSQILIHLGASAAAFVMPTSGLDMLRCGISLYGAWPSEKTRISAQLLFPENPPQLRPVLSLKCPSQCLKYLPPGHSVGYGLSYRCQRRTLIGVFPVGYYDGLMRAIGEKGMVLVNGQRCRILGRVMMNHIVVDLSDLNPLPHLFSTSSEKPQRPIATLIGSDGEEEITADQHAQWAQTINYEILTRLPAHLPRTIVNERQEQQQI